MDARVERRDNERIASELATVCRAPATPHRARLVDVSTTGCRLRTLDGTAIPNGATVLLDFTPGGRISGQVMWSGPHTAGIRFDNALSQKLAVVLGLAQAPAVEVTLSEPLYVAPAPGSVLAHWLRRLLRRAA
jgi:hypothetical protein